MFDSDFADLFEVRGLRRPRRGTLSRRIISTGAVVLHYDGVDGKPRIWTVFAQKGPVAGGMTYLTRVG